MDMANICIAALGLFAAGVLKGSTGIGFSTCALPFLVAAVGLRPAMAIIIVPALWSNIGVIASGGYPATVIRRFWCFYAGIVPGIFIGAGILLVIDGRVATQVLAVTTLAYVGLALARPDISLPSTLERSLALPAGLANGILTGLTGSQILPLMPYMMSLKLAAEEQVQAVNLAVAIASVVLAVALFQTGIMTRELAVASLAGCIPAAVGVSLGGAIRRQLSATGFKHVALAALAALALSLYGRQGMPQPCGMQTPNADQLPLPSRS